MDKPTKTSIESLVRLISADAERLFNTTLLPLTSGGKTARGGAYLQRHLLSPELRNLGWSKLAELVRISLASGWLIEVKGSLRGATGALPLDGFMKTAQSTPSEASVSITLRNGRGSRTVLFNTSLSESVDPVEVGQRLEMLVGQILSGD